MNIDPNVAICIKGNKAPFSKFGDQSKPISREVAF